MSDGELWAIRSRVESLLELDRMAEAADLARQGLAQAPEDSVLLAYLALALARTDAKGARQAAERAVAADPDDPWVHQVAARVLLVLEKPKDARRHAERAVALAPLDANGHLVLAQAYDGCGLPTKAARAVDEVIRLAPGSPAGFVERSRLSLQARDWSGAERWARQALEIDPSSPAALNNLAVALEHQGKRGEALDLFARAAAAEPGDHVAAENARNTARNLGGVALGGFALFGLLQAVRISFYASAWAGLAALVLIFGGLAVISRVRFTRALEHLPPHLREFAIRERQEHWRRPRSWLGRTREQRVVRVLLAVGLPVLFFLARDRAEDEPDRGQINPEYVRCIAESGTATSLDCPDPYP